MLDYEVNFYILLAYGRNDIHREKRANSAINCKLEVC